VVVPATALALMSGLGSLLTGAWLPGLAGLLNNTTWLLMKFILWFSGCAAHWPGGHWNVTAPTAAVCIYYYGVLLLLVTGWLFRSRHKWIVAAALAAVAVIGAVHAALDSRTVRLDVLPINGAPAIFAPGTGRGEKVLIDCGSEDSAGELIKPFLSAQGVNRLAGLCLAVGRLEYFGGTRLILNDFPAKEVFTAAAHERSPALRDLSNELRRTQELKAVKDGPAPLTNSPKPTTTPWFCGGSSTAIPSCCSPPWGATARTPSCDATRTCARKSSSPDCPRATSRCASHCWTNCDPSSSCWPTRNSPPRAAPRPNSASVCPAAPRAWCMAATTAP
jgi:hypothetical protein